MFMLRSDGILVMYEETSPHLPLKNQIRKEYFNLKLADGSCAITNLEPESIQIRFFDTDKALSNLILTFSNKDERYDWYTLMSGELELGEEEIVDSDDDKATVNSMNHNAEGIQRNTMKSINQVETANFCVDHRSLVNQTLKERLEDKESKLTKFMADALFQNK